MIIPAANLEPNTLYTFKAANGATELATIEIAITRINTERKFSDLKLSDQSIFLDKDQGEADSDTFTVNFDFSSSPVILKGGNF